MLRGVFAKLACGAIFLLLTGCVAPVQPLTPFPALDFQGKPVFLLDATKIQIVSSPAAAPEAPLQPVDFPVMPRDVALAWAGARLQAGGGSALVTFHVQEALAYAEPLTVKDGVGGFFLTEPKERLTASLKVVITATMPTGSDARTVAEASITRDVPEDASPEARQAIWFSMTEALANELDARLDAGMQRYFSAYLKNP